MSYPYDDFGPEDVPGTQVPGGTPLPADPRAEQGGFSTQAALIVAAILLVFVGFALLKF